MKKSAPIDERAVRELTRQMTKELERPRAARGGDAGHSASGSTWTDSFRAFGGKHN